MKKMAMLSAVFLLLGVGTTYAEITRLVKIGYVDVEEVFENYPGTDDVREELLELKEEHEAMIAELEDEIVALELEYELNYSSLTDEERQRREAEIEYKEETLSEYIEAANDELDSLEDTLTDPILLKIMAVIQKVSSEEGYSFVFKESSTALLYTDDEFDLTEDVIDRLETELSLEDRY